MCDVVLGLRRDLPRDHHVAEAEILFGGGLDLLGGHGLDFLRVVLREVDVAGAHEVAGESLGLILQRLLGVDELGDLLPLGPRQVVWAYALFEDVLEDGQRGLFGVVDLGGVAVEINLEIPGAPVGRVGARADRRDQVLFAMDDLLQHARLALADDRGQQVQRVEVVVEQRDRLEREAFGIVGDARVGHDNAPRAHDRRHGRQGVRGLAVGAEAGHVLANPLQHDGRVHVAHDQEDHVLRYIGLGVVFQHVLHGQGRQRLSIADDGDACGMVGVHVGHHRLVERCSGRLRPNSSSRCTMPCSRSKSAGVMEGLAIHSATRSMHSIVRPEAASM